MQYLTTFRNTKEIKIPSSEIATFVLNESDLESECGEDKKKDAETLLIDPISMSGYIVQKVRKRNTDKTAFIFKVRPKSR